MKTLSFLLLAVSLAGQGVNPPVNPTGAVSSVTGSGTITCSPTTGAVICTSSSGGVGSFPTSIFSVSGSTASYATGQTANYIIGSNGSGTIGLYSPATVLGYTINSGTTGQIAYYASSSAISGETTIPAAALPTPTATTLGGVESIVAVAHNFLTSVSTSGVHTQAQPAFTDLSGSLPLTQMATQAANTVVMNATASSAVPTAVAMPTCTTGADLYNTSTNTWSCVSTGGGGVTFSPPYLVSGGNYYIEPDFGFQATLPPAFTTGYTTLSGTMTPSAGGGNGDIVLTSLYSTAFIQQTASVSSSIEAVFNTGEPTGFATGNTYSGIYVCDSTNAKIWALYVDIQSSYSPNVVFISYSVTSGTGCTTANTPSAGTTTYSSFYTGSMPHLKLAWSGGTLTPYQSVNGGASYKSIGTGVSVGTIASSGFMGAGFTADIMSFKVQ